MNTIVWNNVKQIIVTLSNCHPSHCLFNSCNYIKAPCLITSGSTSDSILSSTSGSTSTCFCGMVDRRKAEPYFQPGPLSESLTIANLRHAASRIWTCAKSVFRLWWMKMCSSDNHYTTAPLNDTEWERIQKRERGEVRNVLKGKKLPKNKINLWKK